jgi:SAM-dependent methyltransferase
MAAIGQLIVCPDCGGGLLGSTDVLECPRCGKHWPIVDGVPHFVSEFPYWGEIPIEQMQEINRRSMAGSWRKALLDSPEPSVQRASQMILNLERANWHWLADLSPHSRVLDLGAGTGTSAHALALHYDEVVALEPVLERVQFMRQRFAQERLSNVRIVRSSVWRLPFADESMDMVAMNGVLEWVAEGVPGDPRELQESALKRVFRLLRGGGYLYLGIENRFCPGYFIGYNDPHCGLPYVTVLPRPLAQWYARHRGAAGYRNYLYSSRGYVRLLHKIGFARVDIYAAIPSYNDPRFLLPLKRGAFSHYVRSFAPGGSRLRRIAKEVLLRANLLQHLTYAFAIVAQKPGAEPPTG